VTWQWVEVAIVHQLHETALQRFGGLPGCNDAKLLGALQRPENLAYYEGANDAPLLAAAYLVAIARAHAFSDANKRTAWTTAAVFLELNGYDLHYTDDDAIEMVVQAAEGRIDIHAVTTWYAGRVTKRPA
jgi:death on curing protein